MLPSPIISRNFSARAGSARPTHLLLNGGVLQAAAIEHRLFEVLNGWLAESGAPPIIELRNATKQADLMHAVAHGAAYYGLARAGKGVRIRGGVPRTYYVGIESSLPAVPGLPAPMKALAVVPVRSGRRLESGTAAAQIRARRRRARRIPLLLFPVSQNRCAGQPDRRDSETISKNSRR